MRAVVQRVTPTQRKKSQKGGAGGRVFEVDMSSWNSVMKRAVTGAAIGFLFLAGAAPKVCRAQRASDNQTESPDLLESRRLNATVLKLYADGKYDDALPLAKRALE